MKRRANWWSLVLVVFGILLPMLAVGCYSTKQATGPEIFGEDRTGTVHWLMKKPNDNP